MTQLFAHHCTIARCDMLLSMAVLLLWIAQPAQAARQGRYAPLIRKAHTWPAKRVVAAGDSLLSRGDEDDALVLYLLAGAKTSTDELSYRALGQLKAGDIYSAQGNYISALERYQAALKACEQTPGRQHLVMICKSIGTTYCLFGDFGRGKEFYQRGLRACPKADDAMAFKLYANLTVACVERGDWADARRYLHLMRTRKHPQTPVNAYMITFDGAILAARQGRQAEAVAMLEPLVELCRAKRLPPRYACSAYEELYKAHRALGHTVEAIHYAQACMETARQSGLLHYYPEAMRDLGRMLKKAGQTDRGTRLEADYLALKDSVYNAQRFNVLKNQQFAYEVGKASKEIDRLQEEEEAHRLRARLYLWGLLTALIVAGVVSALLIAVARQKHRLEASYRKLYDLSRQTASSPSPQRAISSPLSDARRDELAQRIRQVMEQTEQWCAPDFTLTALARRVESNERYVSLVINECFGRPFTDLLNDYRIRKACQRLADDARYARLTIAAVGQSVGYRSQTTFINQFKKHTGLTPSVYQKFAREDRRQA